MSKGKSLAVQPPETVDRVTQCSACGRDMVGPRSRNKGIVTEDGVRIGHRRELASVSDATCSNCVSSVGVGQRRRYRAEQRAYAKAARA